MRCTMSEEIIKLDKINVTFEQKNKRIDAVKEVTLHVNKGVKLE